MLNQPRAFTTRSTRAWNLAQDCLDDTERAAVRDRALAALSAPDRAVVERTAKRLARDVRTMGEASALHLLAVIGGLLSEHPEWIG